MIQSFGLLDELAKQGAEEEKKEAAETPAKPRTDTQKRRRPNRGSLPAHLPRVHVTIEPESIVCPCCQGQMHMISDETAERLDSIPPIDAFAHSKRCAFFKRDVKAILLFMSGLGVLIPSRVNSPGRPHRRYRMTYKQQIRARGLEG
jgi:hypothetical protein